VRGRAGDGAHFTRRFGAVGVEALTGRFARRSLAGARLSLAGPGGAGTLHALGAPHGALQGGLAFAAADAVLEYAGDRRGRWRAEWSLLRRAGPWQVLPRVRAGHPGFRSLAEPRRAGPARLVSLALVRDLARWRLAAGMAQWQWQRGRSGSRLVLEAVGSFAEHDPVVLGWEERQGPQRETATSGTRRQTWWGELGAGSPVARLGLRYERGGEGPWGARLEREATTLRAAGEGPCRVGWAVSHTVHRASGAGAFHVLESEPGRIVLRALSGRGQRSVARLALPSGAGRVELQVISSEIRGKPAQLGWQVRWVRRARLGRGRAEDP
jgi:hypothetical protein